LIAKQGSKFVKFENCAVADNSGAPSDIPYYNVFTIPFGESMSELCIANNCRSRLANMARRIF